MNRSKKLVLLALENDNNSLLYLPKWETTKGTSPTTQDVAVRTENIRSLGICSDYNKNVTSIDDVTMKGNSQEYIDFEAENMEASPPSSEPLDNDYGNFVSEGENGFSIIESTTDDSRIEGHSIDKGSTYIEEESSLSLIESTSDEYLPSTDSSLEYPNGMDLFTARTRNKHTVFDYKNKLDNSLVNSSSEWSKSLEVRSSNGLSTPLKVSSSSDYHQSLSHRSSSTKQELYRDSIENHIISMVGTPLRSKTSNENVSIPVALNCNGKRIRNKLHSCYFCTRTFIHLAKHFEAVHSNEIEVAKILAHPKKSKLRKQGFEELLKVGDFYHNCDVLAKKEGELFLIRRPTADEYPFKSHNDYGPCPNCLGFLLKKHIWLHVKQCSSSSSSQLESNKRHISAESNALLNVMFGNEFSSDYLSNIINKFRDDEIGKCCKEDSLVMRFGAVQYEKYGTTQLELIRQTMRQMARLLIELRKLENNKLPLESFFTAKKFDLIIRATKSLCVSQLGIYQRPEFEIPSLALKIGYSIKKCVAILRGLALRSQNLQENESLQGFLTLMNLEWNARISSNALATLNKRKFNTTELLPLTSDLVKLNKYIQTEIECYKKALLNKSNLFNWTRLAVLVLSRLILFNKRRSGETSRMTSSQYSNKPLWTEQSTQEIQESMTDFERKLAHELHIVEIMGKRGRKVPVIVTANLKTSIDLLIETGNTAGIAPNNPFIFACTGNSLSHIRGHDALRKVCMEVDLESPDRITSTKLRKYVATVSQVFDLTENESDWLAKHLGHDIRVHRDFYRLHDNIIELSKVSRLLLAVDKGETKRFAGCALRDINIADLPNLEEDEEITEEEEEIDDHDDIRHETITGYSGSEGNVNNTSTKAKKNKKSRNMSVSKKQWSIKEKECIFNFFKMSKK